MTNGVFKYPIDLTRQIHHSLWIHSDIIEPTLIDRNNLQLLRILPLNAIPRMYTDELFLILQWKNIISKRTSKIRIWVTCDGDEIPIKSDIFVILQIQ